MKSIDDPLAVDLKRELLKKLTALDDIGLGYLTLSRGTGTLSGGEAQRIKIAKYANSALTDMAYVLDEPSVGLHPQDIARLKRALLRLRDHGNTVLIVEHHREILALADHLIELGPKAGSEGGEVLYTGDLAGLLSSDTATGRMLRRQTGLKETVRAPKSWFSIEHATLHNLKDVSVSVPLGVLTVVAGVAGSGKSSLMESFLQQYDGEAISIRQKDIGINLRSTPATYLDIADPIRKRFAKKTGQPAALFSFNSKGACPVCGGKGVITSDMAFMDTIETPCEACRGTRYSDEALQYTDDGKTIADVMALSVRKAARFFKDEPFAPALQALERVGLGYLRLNQSMTTLSGGELQRVKLASYLDRKGDLFILDEPTDGLHLDDIRRLMEVFQQMVDAGNTVILIEHSLDVLKEADYVIELGPGGGRMGGQLLFAGTPKELLNAPHSVTAPYLRQSLHPFTAKRSTEA